MLCAMARSQGGVVPLCGRELGWLVKNSRIWTICWRNASGALKSEICRVKSVVLPLSIANPRAARPVFYALRAMARPQGEVVPLCGRELL